MRTIERVLRQQSALAKFGSFAFRQDDLKRVCSKQRAYLGHCRRVSHVALSAVVIYHYEAANPGMAF